MNENKYYKLRWSHAVTYYNSYKYKNLAENVGCIFQNYVIL